MELSARFRRIDWKNPQTLVLFCCLASLGAAATYRTFRQDARPRASQPAIIQHSSTEAPSASTISDLPQLQTTLDGQLLPPSEPKLKSLISKALPVKTAARPSAPLPTTETELDAKASDTASSTEIEEKETPAVEPEAPEPQASSTAAKQTAEKPQGRFKTTFKKLFGFGRHKSPASEKPELPDK